MRKQRTFWPQTCNTFCKVCKLWRGYFLRKLRHRESEGGPDPLFVVLHFASQCISVNGRKHKKHTCIPQVCQRCFWKKSLFLRHFTSEKGLSSSIPTPLDIIGWLHNGGRGLKEKGRRPNRLTHTHTLACMYTLCLSQTDSINCHWVTNWCHCRSSEHRQ